MLCFVYGDAPRISREPHRVITLASRSGRAVFAGPDAAARRNPEHDAAVGVARAGPQDTPRLIDQHNPDRAANLSVYAHPDDSTSIRTLKLLPQCRPTGYGLLTAASSARWAEAGVDRSSRIGVRRAW